MASRQPGDISYLNMKDLMKDMKHTRNMSQQFQSSMSSVTSTLKAVEEQKMNGAFKNTGLYVKPLIQADFQGQNDVRPETLKDVIRKRQIKHRLYMNEFYETDPKGQIDYLRAKVDTIRVTGDSSVMKQRRPAGKKVIKVEKKGSSKKFKNIQEYKEEETRQSFIELMQYLSKYRQLLCNEPLGYIPNGRKKKDQAMDDELAEIFASSNIFEFYTD